MGRERLITIDSPENMELFGEKVGKNLPPKALLFLHGDLGAGKTCFVQGLARGLAIEESITSPTFTYLNLYEGKSSLLHFDLYRFRSGQEFFDRGFDEYLEQAAVVAIEWAEKLQGYEITSDLELFFSHKAREKRDVLLKGHLLDSLHQI